MIPDRYMACGKQGRPVPAFVVDCHMHLGENPEFPILHYEDLDLLVRVMDRCGVAVGGVSAIPGCLGGLLKDGNAAVIEALRRYPKRFFGWMSINPHYADAMRRELARCYRAGCRGIKVHSSIGLAYEHPNYRVAYDFAADRGLPILAHTWGAELDKLEPLVREYGGVKWSFAHAGAAEPAKYVRLASECENVYLDLCYSRSPRGLIEFFVSQGIVEKLLFSSDCYFMGLGQQLGRVLFGRITPKQKALILGENARRFFGPLCPV